MLSKFYISSSLFRLRFKGVYNLWTGLPIASDRIQTKLKYSTDSANVSFKYGNVFLLLSLGTAYLISRQHQKSMFPEYNLLGISKAHCSTKANVRLRDKFNFIADVVEDSAEAVVYIEIVDTRHRNPVASSNGSGFIVQSDGLILTNAHVVMQHGPSAVRVRLTNGQTYQGRVESVDMQSDLATIRINADNLPVMRLGKSSDLRCGEWVVAIGSPLSLSNTVTAGVVSASQRPGTQLGIPLSGINYIQTDASITFGNSGGPLVNLDGEAIGVNSIKITAGISFAIPIDHVKEFLAKNQNKKQGPTSQTGVSKKFIGITMVTLKPEFIHALHARGLLPVNVSSGILVWKIAEGGPAYRAGLRPGDVMILVNGKPADSVQQIYEALEFNSKLHIRALRNGHPMDLVVVPEES